MSTYIETDSAQPVVPACQPGTAGPGASSPWISVPSPQTHTQIALALAHELCKVQGPHTPHEQNQRIHFDHRVHRAKKLYLSDKAPDRCDGREDKALGSLCY